MPRRSELFTEDPFYLPRYCGYLPQYKYRIGKTYGHHSADILKDPDVRKSGTYVLTDTEYVPEGRDTRRLLLQSRQDSWGNQIHTEQLVPGYTGYIPKSQHYFAKSYAEVCRSALAHHEYEQRQIKDKQKEMRKVLGMNSGKVRLNTERDKHMSSTHQTTMSQNDAKQYKPSEEFRPYGSPYFMADSNDMKWFKSGYTGFVPRTRELIAMDYPTMTSRGLSTFTNGMAANQNRKNAPIQLEKRESNPQDKTVIYPMNRGMVPHYTGYIPGYKYKIGHTYGRHTYDTMKLSPKRTTRATAITVT
ncbi:ciliary microtubule inner protein 2B-like [Styela clava]|uniref:protein FAM166B-like n=1 Tax=Styela clava TaxID=7725 RepID=UPI001939CE3B|nr:protein FAM166B-like [Styela clava]